MEAGGGRVRGPLRHGEDVAVVVSVDLLVCAVEGAALPVPAPVAVLGGQLVQLGGQLLREGLLAGLVSAAAVILHCNNVNGVSRAAALPDAGVGSRNKLTRIPRVITCVTLIARCLANHPPQVAPRILYLVIYNRFYYRW